MYEKKHFLSSMTLLVLLLLLSLSVHSEEYYSEWRITNKTAHFVHVLINEQSFLYISPEKFIVTEVETREVRITAFYAPGQGVSGKWSKSYTIAPDGAPGCGPCPTSPDHYYGLEVTPEGLQ